MKIKLYKSLEKTVADWSFGSQFYKDSWADDEVSEMKESFNGYYILIDFLFWSVSIGLEFYKNK